MQVKGGFYDYRLNFGAGIKVHNDLQILFFGREEIRTPDIHGVNVAL